MVNDGETLKFWLTARDVLANELTVPNIVRLDNSEPVLGKPHTKVNVFNESDAVPFGTRSVDKRATNCYLCSKIKMLDKSSPLINYLISSHMASPLINQFTTMTTTNVVIVRTCKLYH